MPANFQASPTEDQSGVDRRAGGWTRWLLALVLAAALAFAVWNWGDLERFAELAGRAEPAWLLGALLLQLATYVSLSMEWSLILRAGGCSIGWRRLLPLTITKLFADQVVPTAGVSGNVLLVDRLIARGVPREIAVAAAIGSIIAYYASYTVCALVVVVLLWLHRHVSWPLIGMVGLFLLVAVAIPATMLRVQAKGREAVPAWFGRIAVIRDLLALIGDAPTKLVRSRRLMAQLVLLNGAGFVADALTLQFCLWALGQPAPFDTAFVALILASIVVTLGPVPLGLGSFEAVSTGTLRLMGVPLEAGLSATLLFRGFALWLPLALGVVLARPELGRSRT